MQDRNSVQAIMDAHPEISWEAFPSDELRAQVATKIYETDMLGRATTAKQMLNSRTIQFHDRQGEAVVEKLKAKMGGSATKGRTLKTLKIGDKSASLTVNLVHKERVKNRIVDADAPFWNGVERAVEKTLEGVDLNAIGEVALFTATGNTKNIPVKVYDLGEYELRYSLGNQIKDED